MRVAEQLELPCQEGFIPGVFYEYAADTRYKLLCLQVRLVGLRNPAPVVPRGFSLMQRCKDGTVKLLNNHAVRYYTALPAGSHLTITQTVTPPRFSVEPHYER